MKIAGEGIFRLPQQESECALQICEFEGSLEAQKGSLQVYPYISVSGGLCSSVCSLTLGRVAGLSSAPANHCGFWMSIPE